MKIICLLSICDSNEKIGFVHGKSIFFIEVLDDHFIDKKVIFSEKMQDCYSPQFIHPSIIQVILRVWLIKMALLKTP
jgi:hypothetical protein